MKEKQEKYKQVIENISVLIKDEDDEIAIMATVVCELHNTFDYFNWTGFYRCTKPDLLKIGPYQGTHGCLTIAFDRGVCGKAAREKKTQIIKDISKISYHIACSTEIKSEIVVPILDKYDNLHSILDVDSDSEEAFNDIDREYLEKIVVLVKEKFSK